MELLTWAEEHSIVLTNVATAVAGYVVAMVVSYVKLTQDLSFIKGQLTEILKMQVSVSEISSKHDILERDIQKIAQDIVQINVRLFAVEKQTLKEI